MKEKQAAISYLKNLNSYERERLKNMLSHGIYCCRDYALKNELNFEIFNEQLKSILGGKE